VRALVVPKPVFRFEPGPSGEVALVAREVPITQALDAIANHVGFEVSVYSGVARPPVNLTLPMTSVGRALRELLRGRNYALVYDQDTAALRRVILLAPPNSRPSVRAGAAPRGPARQKAHGAIVIRR